MLLLPEIAGCRTREISCGITGSNNEKGYIRPVVARPARHNWLKSCAMCSGKFANARGRSLDGITLLSAENLRAGNIWKGFMRLPEILARWIQRV